MMNARLIPLFLMVALSLGCSRTQNPKRTAKAKDGTSIVYEVRGKGPTTLVFINCLSCNRNFWRNQIGPFSKDFQVVTLDLGGQGESGMDRKDWRILDLAGDVEAVIDDLKAKQVILVGHSMGGPIALKVAADRPQTVTGIACVDTLQNAEQAPPKELFDSFAAQMESNYSKSMSGFLPQMFGPNADPAVVQWVIDQVLNSNSKVTIALFRDLSTVDVKSLMINVKVPIRCVNAVESPPMKIRTATDVNKRYSDFDVISMADVGHYPHLEKPDEFNSKLRQSIDAILKK
jgi:pimeloyl-ACP methyl ester carboxylesterase